MGRCLNFALLMDKVYQAIKASEKKKPSKIQAGVWNMICWIFKQTVYASDGLLM